MADIHTGSSWASGADRPADDRGFPGPRGDRPRVDYSGTPGAEPHPADQVIEQIAWIMDGFIQLPGGYRIGLDPIVGLIPGLGDMLGAAVSSIIVVQAHRAGIPKPTLLRMVANVGVDAVIGAIPFLGDFFDFAFKVNQKNLELYRQARAGTRDTKRDWGFLILLLLLIGLMVAIPIAAVFWLAKYYLA
jgi:hypothetical protein